jgi:aspartate aminotransferase
VKQLKTKLNKIPFSVTLKYTQLAQELQAQGKEIVRLTAGEPDFATPESVSEAGVQAIRDHFTKYTPAAGIPELRKGISDFLKKKYSLGYEANQIIVSNGGKQALYETIYAITDEEDEVVIFTPDWVSYAPQVEMCGCKVVFVETKFEDDFQPDIVALKAAITQRTRAIIVNSPNNPTGTVYSRETLEGIARIAVENDLWIISDEIYANLIYEGKHVSFGTIPGAFEKTITVNGFSKSHAMTGWRCGYVAAPIEIAKEIGKMQSHLSSNVNSITQKAALKALSVDTEYMRTAFEERKSLMCEGLDAIGIEYCKPKGAFYVFMDFSWIKDTYEDDDALAMALIKDYGLALVPGSAFHAPWFMRLSYASSAEELKKALKILEKFKQDH